jgi:hypothetical protein
MSIAPKKSSRINGEWNDADPSCIIVRLETSKTWKLVLEYSEHYLNQ